MNAGKAVRSAPASPTALRRSRWPVLLTALALLWCAWGYCRDGSPALLYVAAGMAVLSMVRPRALPSTTRWIVWWGVAVLVVCLAANVSRLLAPSEKMADSMRSVERVATAFFALGLSALFFRPSTGVVTLAAAGGLPMVMAVLLRDASSPGNVAGWPALFVCGFLAFVAAADLAQRVTQPSDGDAPLSGAGEWAKRAVVLIAVLAASCGLRDPFERTAKIIQNKLLGWALPGMREERLNLGDMRLNIPTDLDFGQRMRVILLVGTDHLPGYLRECVYLQYRRGKWSAVKPEHELKAMSGGTGTGRGEDAYALTPFRDAPSMPVSVWHMEVMASGRSKDFYLPGNAVSLVCSGAPPLAETNGTLSAAERLPDRYAVSVRPRRLLESAYPCPSGSGNAVYLEVPAELSGAVSNWTAQCPGLNTAVSARAAIPVVETYFAAHFTYRLGVRLKMSPDPLVDFMSRKEGSCAHFSSAAALMFRSCGIPARVVGGYVCSEWSPWLKRWVVRERQGHAWVEVWDAAAGCWLVADPTPPAGRPSAWRKASRLRQMMDLAIADWKRLLVYLSNASILEVIADAGAWLAAFLWHVMWSFPGAVVLIGGAVIAWLRHRRRLRGLAPAERLRADMARTMARLARRSVAAHLRRRPAESWSAWLGRVSPELTEARAAELRERLETYQALRYQAVLDESAARAWIAAVSSDKSAPGGPRAAE